MINHILHPVNLILVDSLYAMQVVNAKVTNRICIIAVQINQRLKAILLSRIELNLDDGVKVNYRKLQTASDGKFYEVLADSKNIMSKK